MVSTKFTDKHPADVIGLFQKLQWIEFKESDHKEIKEGKEVINHEHYKFEIISFYKMKSFPFRSGGYVSFAAVAISSHTKPEIIQDPEIILEIQFPYQTFSNAYMVFSPQKRRALLRKSMEENDLPNVFIHFIKHRENRLEIVEMYPMKAKPELTRKADQLVYDNEIFDYHKDEGEKR